MVAVNKNAAAPAAEMSHYDMFIALAGDIMRHARAPLLNTPIGARRLMSRAHTIRWARAMASSDAAYAPLS